MNDKNLIQTANRFLLEGEVIKVFPFGSGHINDTYKVETTGPDYLLQRVNQEVFKNVDGLMENILAVTGFLDENIRKTTSEMVSLQLVPLKEDDFSYRDSSGNTWRMFHFIPQSVSFDRVENQDMAMEGGRAYGWFVRMLDTYPAQDLIETIPRFHSAAFRIDQFLDSVREDRAGRLKGIRPFVNDLMERKEKMLFLYNLGKEKKLPVRVTHNDTKINNILFNDQGKALCIIDLDTVMPGYIHFDYGDAIRTFANLADEDEKDLDKSFFSIELFEAFTKGFLSETHAILTEKEKETLVFGPLYIVYEQTLRFLTDYLDGDRYYKIHFPGHNLVRAKAQAQLLSEMQNAFPQMKEIISSLV